MIRSLTMDFDKNSNFVLTLCFAASLLLCNVDAAHWAHSADLSPDYRLLWTLGSQEITFEVQVRTLGYIALGFARGDEVSVSGADMVVGWVDNGQVYFQVSHFCWIRLTALSTNFT